MLGILRSASQWRKRILQKWNMAVLWIT